MTWSGGTSTLGLEINRYSVAETAIKLVIGFMVFTWGFQTGDLSRQHKMAESPVFEFSHVSVLDRIGPRSWRMSKSDGDFRFDCCPDYDCASKLRVGYVAWKLRYQDMGDCDSMRRSDLGVWWHEPGSNAFVQVASVKEN